MTTDYRALCAELVELSAPVDSISRLAWRLQQLDRLANRARALLAEPEPEGPTDEELDELFTEIDQSGEALSWRLYARAALARWGRPTPQFPADGEVAELVEWLHRRAAEVQAENCTTIYSPHLLRRVADLLGQTEPERSASMMYYARQCNTQAVAALVALEVLADAADQFGPAGGADGKALAAEVKKARGVLARTLLAEADGPAVPDGREPASVALQPSDGEVAELVEWLRESLDCALQSGNSKSIKNHCRLLDVLGRPTPQPVAESERLPGPSAHALPTPEATND